MNVLFLCTENSCRSVLSPVLRSQWGVEDLAHITGSDAEIGTAFMTAYRFLHYCIETFIALPLDRLQNDPTRLKAELDRIGTQVP